MLDNMHMRNIHCPLQGCFFPYVRRRYLRTYVGMLAGQAKQCRQLGESNVQYYMGRAPDKDGSFRAISHWETVGGWRDREQVDSAEKDFFGDPIILSCQAARVPAKVKLLTYMYYLYSSIAYYPLDATLKVCTLLLGNVEASRPDTCLP